MLEHFYEMQVLYQSAESLTKMSKQLHIHIQYRLISSVKVTTIMKMEQQSPQRQCLSKKSVNKEKVY